MAVRSSRIGHDDRQALQADMVGHVAAYAVGGVLFIAILYVAALYFFVG